MVVMTGVVVGLLMLLLGTGSSIVLCLIGLILLPVGGGLRLEGQVISFGNKSVLPCRVLYRDDLPVSSGVGIKTPTRAVRVHSLALLESIVRLEVEINRAILVQGPFVCDQQGVGRFLGG
jgi:hypothetical protein